MIRLLIELTGTAECSEITADILLDNQLITTYTCSLKSCTVPITLEDNHARHTLSVIMQGKTHQHTVVDDQGHILEDASISITKLEFEDIDMMTIFCQGAICYTHSFNDVERPAELDEFYGYMGCNGAVNIEFDTPIYLWFNKHF